MKFPRLLTQKRDPLARQKIRYILNQPVHKRARVVRFSLPPINDPHKNKENRDDIIPLADKTRRFEVKKFETLDNVHYEKREEETIRLRWTSRLEKEAENISKVFNRSDTNKEDVLKLPKLVHVHKSDRKCRNSCNVCEASRIISASPVDKVFREHREHGISCKCTVCETVNKIRAMQSPMQSPSPSESEKLFETLKDEKDALNTLIKENKETYENEVTDLKQQVVVTEKRLIDKESESEEVFGKLIEELTSKNDRMKEESANIKTENEMLHLRFSEIDKEMSEVNERSRALLEENAKLVGHQNLKQKIHYTAKLKDENNFLREQLGNHQQEIMKLKSGTPTKKENRTPLKQWNEKPWEETEESL
ncbi:Hypothetical predicted protein [Mytilus galloprovincialis]|uniref:Hyaluronan-mediated motility receptor C-terminal domain-containing protein n=1 Tax=Mytilus galloprovincialis TaxID=29158 RepID=A0A8B6EQV9_MYTGA|nr:Hypothetical predicted protein [Mytilus galloprovincialis]